MNAAEPSDGLVNVQRPRMPYVENGTWSICVDRQAKVTVTLTVVHPTTGRQIHQQTISAKHATDGTAGLMAERSARRVLAAVEWVEHVARDRMVTEAREAIEGDRHYRALCSALGVPPDDETIPPF